MGHWNTDLKDDIAIVRLRTSRATVADGVDDLKTGLVEMILRDRPHVIVDMQIVEFADSSMLGALVSALKVAARKRGDIKLVGLQPSVRAIFALTRLDRVFEIYDDEEGALASF